LWLNLFFPQSTFIESLKNLKDIIELTVNGENDLNLKVDIDVVFVVTDCKENEFNESQSVLEESLQKIQFPLDKYDIVLWGTEENDPVNVKAILDKKKIQKS